MILVRLFFLDMTYDLHLMLQTGGLETISLVDTLSVRSQWDLAFQSVILLHFTYISMYSGQHMLLGINISIHIPYSRHFCVDDFFFSPDGIC